MIIQQNKNKIEQLQAKVSLLAKIIQNLKQQKIKSSFNHRLLVGICGIPGSGKSTISNLFAKKLKNCIVLPMDGFHLYRKQLNQQGVKRRGAIFTFNMTKFQQKIRSIKQQSNKSHISYPDFDHKQKDPVQDAIQIGQNIQIVIIEGIYIFDKNLSINSKQKDKRFWDAKIWINANLQICMNRVANRHLESGIQITLEKAKQRVKNNDQLNAKYILDNCYDNNQYIDLDKWENGHQILAIRVDN